MNLLSPVQRHWLGFSFCFPEMKTKYFVIAAILATTAAAFGVPEAHANEKVDCEPDCVNVNGTSTNLPWVDAVVETTDNTIGKIKVSQPAVGALGMPAMTMVYRAQDKSTLANLHHGDKVRIAIKDIAAAGYYMATQIRKIS